MALSDQDRKTLQIGLFLAAVILAGAIYAKFMVFSTSKTRVENEIGAMNQQIREQTALRSDLIALRDRRAEIEALAQKILLASQRLPSTRNAEGFLAALVQILHTTGVYYRSVRPLAERPHQLFTEIPYKVDANSAFHEFGQFLNLIEENPSRFMRVSHIDITNSRDDPTNHPVNLEITTFMLNDVPTMRVGG
jgi:Tfp pilus assembly protein PilO